jgi:hypothetical protein
MVRPGIGSSSPLSQDVIAKANIRANKEKMDFKKNFMIEKLKGLEKLKGFEKVRRLKN